MTRLDERKCVESSNTKNLIKLMAIQNISRHDYYKKNSINLMKQTKEKYEVIVSVTLSSFELIFLVQNRRIDEPGFSSNL